MGKTSRFLQQIVRQLVCLPIFLYQKMIRPVMKPCCRFYPSCSEYAATAIQQHGVFIGLKLTLFRLLRCHPWAEGGYDPVLSNKEKV